MSTFAPAQYMGLFLAEIEEQLLILNQSILELEKSDGEDSELLQRLFRVTHTLKGSSATMGFDILADLTHQLEDVLEDVREGKIKVNLPLIDALFACLDQLQIWREQLAAGKVLQPAPELLSRLEGVRNTPWEQPFDPELPQLGLSKEILEQSKFFASKNWWVGSVGVFLENDCLMPGVRAYLAYNNAKEWGEVLATAPDVHVLKKGEWAGHMLLWMAIPHQEERDGLLSSILNLSEIREVVFERWEPDKLPTRPAEANQNELNGLGPAHESESEGSTNSTIKVREVHDFVRIEVKKLDALMNLLGELVVDRARLNQIESELESKFGGEVIESLGEVSRHISLVSGELQERILKLRMSPMSQVYSRFPRMIRDLAHQLGKDVELILEGEETELDRAVIQSISEPLIHLIRNSLDHGLETSSDRASRGKNPTGTVKITTEQMGGEIRITVRDDGRGIDPAEIRKTAVERGLLTALEARLAKDIDVLQWIFLPGFSTKSTVSEVSGRGVGMDVVRYAVELMNGRVELESEVNVGTEIRITVPLTLAVIRSLLVDVGNDSYTIPLANVLETLRLPKEDIFELGKNKAIVVRGRTIPLLNMKEWCGSFQEENRKNFYVVLVASGSKQAGLVVDRFIGEQEVVVKPLGRYLGNVQGFSGATLLGNGRVSLIFDIPTLLRGIDVLMRN